MQHIHYQSKKTKFIFLSIKRNILPTLFCLFTVCLLLFSNSNLEATKSALALWANNVVPSLLPFFIATELLGYTNVISYLGHLLNPIMKPLFGIPGIGSYPFIMGFISGYPTGAKIVSNLYAEGKCSKEEAERMLAFTNNSGPLFIVGTVGISLFGNTLLGILLLITHILASLSVGFLFRFWKKGKTSIHNISSIATSVSKPTETVSFSNLGEILSKSIFSSVKTIILIGGFIILFSVILSILQKSHLLEICASSLQPFMKLFGVEEFCFSTSFLAGILELTNGLMQIANIPCKNISINLILTAFLLGFGGISVFLQVYSITAKSKISMKAYLLGKLLHGMLAAFYTFVFITYFPIFNLNL